METTLENSPCRVESKACQQHFHKTNCYSPCLEKRPPSALDCHRKKPHKKLNLKYCQVHLKTPMKLPKLKIDKLAF